MMGGEIASAAVMVAEIRDCEDDSECGLFTAAVIAAGGLIVWSIIDAPITANAINRRIDEGQVALEIGPQLTVPNRGSRGPDDTLNYS